MHDDVREGGLRDFRKGVASRGYCFYIWEAGNALPSLIVIIIGEYHGNTLGEYW